MTFDLETLRAYFLNAPFMADLGVLPVAAAKGRLSSELIVQPRHLQHTGVVHAGVMATMADHTMGIAAQMLAPQGHVILTAELKTSLLRGATGQRLLCEAQVIKAGRTLSFTEAEVWAEDAQGRTLVMKASATMAVVKPKE